MIRIGDFSKIGRVPVSMLRFYADRGLLQPAHVDTATGYRYYTMDQLPRLNRILALKDLGFSLDEIDRLLDENITSEQLRGMLLLRRMEINQQVGEAEAQLARVQARLNMMEAEDLLTAHEVVVKRFDAVPVLAVREISKTPEGIAGLLEEACRAALQNGVELGGAPMVIFHDPEFLPEDLDIEVAIPVNGPRATDLALSGERRLTARRLEGIDSAACIIHEGSFDTIARSYEALVSWIDENGYQTDGQVREVYLRASEGEDGFLTEIQWPVARARIPV